jgi:hypothetical protein
MKKNPSIKEDRFSLSFEKIHKYVLADIDTQVKRAKKALFALFLILPIAAVITFQIYGIDSKIAWVMVGIWLLMLDDIVDVKADPPTKLLLTMWGRRTEIVLGEGLRQLFRKFPFFIDGIPIIVVARNEDFIFPDITCKARDNKSVGGRVKVEIGLTLTPNSGEFMKYIEVGKYETARDIVFDTLAEDIRQMAKTHTWEELVFSQDILALKLILKLINSNGVGISKQQKNAIQTLMSDDDKKDEEKTKNAKELLLKALVDGIGDEHNLGLTISRLNVKNVVPQDKLYEESQRLAIEEQQRNVELKDAETVEMMMEIFERAGILDPNARLNAAQVAQSKSKKVEVASSSTNVEGGGVQDFTKAAAVNSLLQQNDSGNQKPDA